MPTLPDFIQKVLNAIIDIMAISNEDYISLNAEVIGYFNSDFQCEERRTNIKAPYLTRIQLLTKRNKPTEVIEAAREQMLDEVQRDLSNCQLRTESPRYTLGDLSYHICPCQYKHPLFYKLNKLLDSKTLPYSGGYQDQEASTMELLEILKNAMSRERHTEEKKQLEKLQKAREVKR